MKYISLIFSFLFVAVINNFYSQVIVSSSPESSCDGSPVTLSATAPTNCSVYTNSTITFAPQAVSGSATTVSLSDDAVSGFQPIGFTFNFFCNDYTDFRISSNGFITFNNSGSNGCCSGQNIPNGSNPNNLIAFAWEDLDPGNGGQPAENLIRYETIGTAPNRILIVDFFNVDHYPNNNNVTVQLLLYETTNVIEIHTTNMPSDGGRHTMGIENANGTVAYTVAGRNRSNWSTSNEGIRFSPVACTGVTYDWQSPLGTSIGSGSSIVVSPSVPTTYYAVVNSSCGTETASRNLNVLSIDAGNDQCTGGGTITLYPNTTFPTTCDDYDVTTIAFSPQSLSGSATTVSLSDDAMSGALPIGFTFNYFCNDYTQFYLSSNGFISFSSGQPNGCCSGQNLPNGSAPNNLIAFAWEDPDPGNGGQPAENLLRYETIGTAPNRILIVDYFNVDHYPNGNNMTVQMLLYESNSSIEVHTTTMPTDGGNHTMGIENIDGTTAFTVAGRNAASWSATNEGIRFSQKNASVVTWSPGTGLSSTTVLNPLASPATSTDYTITLDDGNGCILSDVVNVSPACPLPIELVNFKGECLDKGVYFNWTTASEINNDYFDIERYDEYSGKWVSLAKIEGAGNSSEFLSYEHLVSTTSKGGYYRLKQTDFDGEYEYSSIEHVTCNNQNIEVTGYPNPAAGEYVIFINDEDLRFAEISIYNGMGEIVLNYGTQENRTTLDVSSLKKGVYNVNVVTKYYSKVIRLIKL